MSLLYRGAGGSLPDGIDNYVAVILTAVIRTQKDIVRFNLNTKRLFLNPFCSVEKPSWLCSYHHISPGFKTVLTILFSRPRNTSLCVWRKPTFNPSITAMKTCYSKSGCFLAFNLKICTVLVNFLTFKPQNAKHLRS